MSAYIYGRFKKEDLYASLAAAKSRYAVLYQGSYATQETARTVWSQKIERQFQGFVDVHHLHTITYEESIGIVYWVYRTLKNAGERELFTKELFRQLKELHGIQNQIRFSKGVVYNSSKVEINFFSSVSGVNSFLSSIRSRGITLFYRGHANPNYTLCPSVMRNNQHYQSENKMYNELLINCPDDFEKCQTHFEKLVKMQHYGLPTRLLDITRNPLVALYFACESHPESYGELILISSENHQIKYPQSDVISILASLAVFPYEKQKEFLALAEDLSIDEGEFNERISRLIHEVRLEKPAFKPEVKRTDILSNYIVYALKNNNRIIKQDGAFILCGLTAKTGSLEDFRYREHDKKVVVLLEKKTKVLEQLETFSITSASLFPEIECVAEYLKNKFS